MVTGLFDLKKMKLESVIDVGETVVCDMCNANYTDSNRSGGFIFGSKAVCPECAPEMQANIEKHNEEKHIKAYCPLGMSFKDFILEWRGGDNTIKFYVEKEGKK